MTLLRNWLARRRAAKEAAEFHRGFIWAMTAYYEDKASMADIEGACHPLDRSHFERGAWKALYVIGRSGVSNDFS